MKNTSRFSIRLLSLLLVTVMMVACLSVGLFSAFAATPSSADESYAQFVYDADRKTFSLLINADKLNSLLEKGKSITMQDIRDFIPNGLKDALQNKDIKAVCDILGLDLKSVLNMDTVHDVLGDRVFDLLFDQYITLDVLLRVMTVEEILNVIDEEAVFAALTYDDVKGLITDEVAIALVDQGMMADLLADPALRQALLKDSILTPLATEAVVRDMLADVNLLDIFTLDQLVELIGQTNALTVMADGTVTLDEVFTYATVADFFAKVMTPEQLVNDVIGVQKAFEVLNAHYTAAQIITTVGAEKLVAAVPTDTLLHYVDLAEILPLLADSDLLEAVLHSDVAKEIALPSLRHYISLGEIKDVFLPILQDFFLEQVADISLNGTPIYSNSKFHVESAFNAVLTGLPSLAEFGASADDIFVSYTLTATVAGEALSATAELGFYGDTSVVKRLATRLSDNFDYDYTDGTLSITLAGGTSLSQTYANLLASDTVDPALQQKVISLFTARGAELRDLFESTSAEEVLEVLSYAPAGSLEAKLYEALLDRPNALALINRVKDRIVNSSYYAQYNGNIVDLYDRIIRESIAEYASADATYDIDESYSFDPIAFLANKFGGIFTSIQGMCDETVINLSLNVHAEAHGFYSLKLKTPDAELAYVLPAGADLSHVFNRAEVVALGVDEWTYDGLATVAVMPEGNVILIPDDYYTVTYYDETGKIVDTQFYLNGQEMDADAAPTIPAKDYYTASWTRTNIGNNIEFRMTYTAIEYKVTFPVYNHNGEILTIDRTYTVEDKSFTEPLAPQKHGYTATWVYDITTPANVTATVRYTPIVYTVTFVDRNGAAVGTDTYTVEDLTITPPTAPTLLGYTVTWPTITVPSEHGNFTVAALYTPIDCTFYMPDGTTVNGSYGEAIDLPAKKGYTVAWVFEVDEAGNATATPFYSANDYTAHVSFGGRTFPVAFTVEADLDALLRAKIQELIDDGTIAPRAGYRVVYKTPTRYESAALMSLARTSSVYDYDLSVEIDYEPIEYEAIFVGNGQIITLTYTVETADTLRAPTVPAKAGYTGAWPRYTLPIGGTTVNAVYTPITYTAVFVADGVIVATREFTLDNASTFPSVPVPVKEGYLGSWKEFTLGASDVLVIAEYVEDPAYAACDHTLMIVFIVVLAVLVVAAVVVIVLFLRRRGEDEGDEEPDPTPDEPTTPEVEEPAEEVVEEPVEEVVEEIVEKPAEETVEETVEEPVEEPAPVHISVPEGERATAVASALSAIRTGKDDSDMSTMLVMPDGRHILINYRKSFRARMIQACDEAKSYYSEIKNYLLSFEGVTASDSWNYEAYAAGRKVQIAKINISGKTIVLFLALDPATLEGSKYKYDDVGARKRFEKTPVKIKVRSPRSFKWAKELIDMTMEALGRPFVALQEKDYIVPYEEKEPLIARDLIQIVAKEVESGKKVDEEEIVNLIANGARIEGDTVVTEALDTSEQAEEMPVIITEAPEEVAEEPAPEVVEEPVVEEPAPEVVEEPVAEEPVVEEPVEEIVEEIVELPTVVEDITPEQASVMLETETAERALVHEVTGTPKKGKQAIVNIDTLNANFESGDTVELATLKEKALVPKAVGRLKVLARGHLSKPLVVKAHAFSIDAVKMILLTGGTPIELD